MHVSYKTSLLLLLLLLLILLSVSICLLFYLSNWLSHFIYLPFSYFSFLIADLSQSMLETVIPRTDPAYIMITAGKHRGQVSAT